MPIGGVGHSVVHLIARVHVKLEIWTHRRLDVTIEPPLNLLTDILVIVSGTELLVELVVRWVIKALDVVGRGRLGSHRYRLTSFASVKISKVLVMSLHYQVLFRMTYVAFMSANSPCSRPLWLLN